MHVKYKVHVMYFKYIFQILYDSDFTYDYVTDIIICVHLESYLSKQTAYQKAVYSARYH